MKKQLLSLVLICIAFVSKSQLYTPGSGVTDIDGNTYPTVIINGREFMAENLRVSRFNNGDLINEMPTTNINVLNPNVFNDTVPGWYSFEGNNNNDLIYGKLYDNAALKFNDRNVCPINWRIPTNLELQKLNFYIAQNNQLFNDTDSTGLRILGTSWGGTNESGLNLTKFNLDYVAAIYDSNGNLLSPAYYYTTNMNISYLAGYNVNFFTQYSSPTFLPSVVRCLRDLDTSNQIIVNAGNGVSDVDGNSYSSVIFGNGQEWMTSNLKTSKYNDGGEIPYLITNETTSPGYCFYYNNSDYNNSVGKLYNYYLIKNEYDKICPYGWKVPAIYEWNKLIDYLGGEIEATKKLKSTTGWNNLYVPNRQDFNCDSLIILNGSNSSTMNILPGGSLGDTQNDWFGFNQATLFLSATHNSYYEKGIMVFIGQGSDSSYFCGPTQNYYNLMELPPDTTIMSQPELNSRINASYQTQFSYYFSGYIRCLRDSGSSSSIEEIQVKPTYKIYPNPANELLMLELNGIDPSFFVVFDAFGRELLKDKLQQKLTSISIENLDSGCYFIQVEGQSQITRFIKN
jgi:uncharacterized protein (TIGR02145 family)